MTMHDKNLSRRTMLKGASALVIGLYLPTAVRAQSGAAQALKGDGTAAVFAPNAFVRVGADDIVTVLSKHIEFGQGPFTGLATLVAEEMDADWSKMRVEHAPSDPQVYKNLLFGIQGTGGSTAIANSYEQMRKAGATARALLVRAASEAWNVPAGEIIVEKSVLKHAASNRQSGFGAFADAAAKLPVPDDVPLKSPADFKLIGRDGAVKKIDVPDKTDGKDRKSVV